MDSLGRVVYCGPWIPLQVFAGYTKNVRPGCPFPGSVLSKHLKEWGNIPHYHQRIGLFLLPIKVLNPPSSKVPSSHTVSQVCKHHNRPSSSSCGLEEAWEPTQTNRNFWLLLLLWVIKLFVFHPGPMCLLPGSMKTVVGKWSIFYVR